MLENQASFGQWLKQRRKGLDLTQEALAELVGCSVWTIIKIEADQRRPSRQIAERLGQHLALNPAEQQGIAQWARLDASALDPLPVHLLERAAGRPAAPPPDERQPDDKWRDSASAPFIVGLPIRQPRHFFGRGLEISRIFGVWRHQPLQNVAVIGPRRSGKTSLLNFLQSVATTPPDHLRPEQRREWLPAPERYQWAFVDFQDARLRRRERLLAHLLEAMGLRAPQPCSLEDFMDVVSSDLQRPTIVLLDEVGAGLAAPELDTSFWDSLRSLASHYTDGQLGFVVAAHDNPLTLALSHGNSSPFFNIFGHTFQLGPLAEADARALIASSPAPFAAADAAWIIEQSLGWPCLIQVLCHTLLMAMADPGGPGDWRAEGRRQMQPFAHLLEQAP